ncbi:hypothetical protein NM688_g5451 [Phlebia brevispora]|uniref:Uncharacterized protein n=1 Tax=Phlebia brevispora TaxID=194682 RepID=A0ACC1SV50_9APHY|nr:hypothetical protein NM688_g5451 [Phlebia brevispora]
MLTLLIERRIREWADIAGLLPSSQNGFRTGYRTHNNSFVLRTAIEWARAHHCSLYVAFVDLTNAFPSVDQPTLWLKLAQCGIQGPLIDWLRMLYDRMQYMVRHEGEWSQPFQAHAGILTGDPASPILWDLYFADVVIRDHDADVILNGRRISHLEQADDVALFSTSPGAVQRKLDDLFSWCGVNFMVMHRTKTCGMVFGPIPRPLPTLYVDSTALRWVPEYPYIGVIFSSTTPDIFRTHLHTCARRARQLAYGCYSVEGYIGALPAWVARTLYTARVDPHLTLACEVIPDVVRSELAPLEDVQHMYLRRLLGLNSRSCLAPLFTETGLLPLRYRRAQLTLQYLSYVLSAPHTIAFDALQESHALLSAGHSSWLSDLWHALHNLPVHVPLNIEGRITKEAVEAAMQQIQLAVDSHLSSTIAYSPRLHLLRDRVELNRNGKKVPGVMAFRQYLRILPADLAQGIARLLAGDHPFAIEQGPPARYARTEGAAALSLLS